MWYTIMAEDVPNSLEKRMQARPEHLARLTALQDAGRLMLAGPFPAIDSNDPGPAGFTGSLIVAEFNNLNGHFNLKIASSHFSKKSQIMRHRLIYQALGDLMPQQIHAISIVAISPTDPN